MTRQQRRAKERKADKQGRSFGYAIAVPHNASPHCKKLIGGVIRGLGPEPKNDDERDDRALACFAVACSELASLDDATRRSSIVKSLHAFALTLIQQNRQNQTTIEGVAERGGVTVSEIFDEAIAEGIAQRVNLAEPAKEH